MSAIQPARPEHPTGTQDPGPLRRAMILVLIGGPLVVIDLTISQNGGRPIDLLNDTVGLALIVWALVLLGTQSAPASVQTRIRITQALGIVMLIWSVVVQVAPEVSTGVLALLISGLSVLGMVMFCAVMRDLCAGRLFSIATERWRFATKAVAMLLGGGWLVSALLTIGRVVTTGDLFASPAFVEVEGGTAILLILLAALLLLFPLILVLIAIVATLNELRGARQRG